MKQQQIREQNIRRILDAAQSEFVKNGFKGTSMQHIADAAGLPKPNLHYYFKNKLGLYMAVLDEMVSLWNQGAEDISAEDDPATVLADWIRNQLLQSQRYPNASKLFAMEVIQGAPRFREHLQQNQKPFLESRVALIESWIAQGKLPRLDPHKLIFLIWSSTQHYANFETQIRMLTGSERLGNEDFADASEFLVDIILRGCRLK